MITKAGMALGLALLIGVSESAHADITSQAGRYLGWKRDSAIEQPNGRQYRAHKLVCNFRQVNVRALREEAPTTAGSVAGWDTNRAGAVVKTPRTGDLAFFHHSHIAIVVGISEGKICTISGNRRNKVTKSCESRNRFKRFRRPG